MGEEKGMVGCRRVKVVCSTGLGAEVAVVVAMGFGSCCKVEVGVAVEARAQVCLCKWCKVVEGCSCCRATA